MCSLLTKVSEFELSSVADEQVLRFQVAVKDVPLVDVGQASQQLEQEKLENTSEQKVEDYFLQEYITMTYLYKQHREDRPLSHAG